MCENSILKVDSMSEKQKQRQECAEFYVKGYKVFEQNVVDKLHSLLFKLDLH